MNIAVCDDENVMQNTLTVLLNRYRKLRRTEIFISKFSSGQDLLHCGKEFDIIFMDYQMDDLNGMETCRILRDRNIKSTIIFVSGFPQIALDAFEVDASRFLTKPVDEKKLYEALDSFRKKTEHDLPIVLKADENVWKIRHSEFIYAVGIGRYSCVVTPNENIEVHKVLKDFEKELPANKFFRCHKSYLVNFQHIANHSATEILLDNGDSIQLGKAYLPSFKKAFMKYVRQHNDS